MAQKISPTLDNDLHLRLLDLFDKPAPTSLNWLASLNHSQKHTNFQYLLGWKEEYDMRTQRFAFPVIDQLAHSDKLRKSVASLYNILFTPNFTPTQTDIENIHALPDRLEEIVDYLDRYLTFLKEVEKEYQESREEGPQSELVTQFERAVKVNYASFSVYIRKDRDEIYPAIVADGRKFIEELRQVLTSEQALSVIPAIGNDRSP